MNDLDLLKVIAHRLRIHSINMTSACASGHPTSCSSIAEIMAVLFFRVMRYKVEEPLSVQADRFVLSKGHAAPILYAVWHEAGSSHVQSSDLLTLRQLSSRFEGHPTPRQPFVDVATGSLGQGLGVAAGMAYIGKYVEQADYRVYCVLGDGEAAEGSVWEAMQFASVYALNNLVAIFDVNRLGQSQETALGHDMETYRKRAEAFGFNAIIVDGHCVQDLCKAFEMASLCDDKPTALLCRTLKGKHFVSEVENVLNWHGKPLTGDIKQNSLQHLQALIDTCAGTSFDASQLPLLSPQPPDVEAVGAVDILNVQLSSQPEYKLGEKIATRAAYGTALMKLCQNNSRVIAFDGDTKNSTYSEKIKKVNPNNYVECFIAEQNLVGVALGASCRGRCIPFISTFGAFFSRAFDQLRMAAISNAKFVCVGSHCGVSIGEDGPSQMALEDLAMFRALPASVVFYPSDAVSCERACELAAAYRDGICYIRTSRPATPVIYDNSTPFLIGKSLVVKQTNNDQVLVISAGVTLHNAIDASEHLENNGINVRVMDLFTVKPLDKEAIVRNARQCQGRIITVEDHYAAGGIGEAICSLVSQEKDISVRKLCVQEVPRSGASGALMEMYGISASAIVRYIMNYIKV